MTAVDVHLPAPKHAFITVIGNVASGKSTLTPPLAKALNAYLVKADELYKTNPFFKDTVVDRSRWSLASDMWFLRERITFAHRIEKQLLRTPVVQDSGLLMSWVYANSRLGAGFMNQNETDFYNMLYKDLTRSLVQETLVIYLRAPIPCLLRRIRERGRAFEIRHHTRRYLTGLEETLIKLVKDLHKKSTKIIEYNTQINDLQDENTRQNVVREIKQMLRSA